MTAEIILSLLVVFFCGLALSQYLRFLVMRGTAQVLRSQLDQIKRENGRKF